VYLVCTIILNCINCAIRVEKHVFTMFCRHFYQYCTTFYNIDNIMLDKYPLRYRSTYDVQRRKCLRKIVGSINELY